MPVLLHIYSFCLILTVHEAFPQSLCAPHDVLDYLNLTRNSEKFINSRPVRDWTRPTEVYLDVYLSAILSVVEKSQIFVSCLWLSTTWHNELISWNPEDFCGITKVSLPREMLWKPDISIYELAEKENGPPSPYLYITHYGDVIMEDVLTVITSCSMDVYKFPFDTQNCHMTISSMAHSKKEDFSRRTPLNKVKFPFVSDEKRRQGSNSRTSSGVNSTSESLAGMGLGGAGEMVDLHFLQMVVQQVQDLRENPPSLAPRAQRYYSRVAKRINTAFILFYFCSSSLFLIVISVEWMD
ncbi:5-hydroxytryptamine receptor 3A-like [Astyanax mexicanus]|uniref:5-hydroxytryptamine receptor 3A-like n=1 Tax=Astyanax mexicanus TaxID=7994 RepID=A0A8T2L9V2_ASTMX|nr:5-hydroxytryptamine receptor 3A-like [Astyanax mexicanus]